ncbi:MAG: hypothetical protein ACOWWM_20990 [Desulfobacterales bacterium]
MTGRTFPVTNGRPGSATATGRKTATRAFLSAMAILLPGFLLVVLGGCSAESPGPENPSIGHVPVMTFSTHPDHLIDAPKQFQLPPETTLSEALEALGRQLRDSYFADASRPESNALRFEVRALVSMPAGSEPARVAVIDIVDPAGDTLAPYLQGSLGGQSTFHILAATFLQPQRVPPLLDGLLLLHNGKRFPVMDHVQLSEIVVPERVGRAVRLAMERSNSGESL